LAERTQPWVVVAEYGAVLEADFACATLTEAGIPARVTGAHLGLFGAGYQGPSMYGAQVMVPWHREDDARRVLEGLEPDDEDDEPDDPPREEAR
jgi:Putative prokaryotic signal transducing protein